MSLTRASLDEEEVKRGRKRYDILVNSKVQENFY